MHLHVSIPHRRLLHASDWTQLQSLLRLGVPHRTGCLEEEEVARDGEFRAEAALMLHTQTMYIRVLGKTMVC